MGLNKMMRNKLHFSTIVSSGISFLVACLSIEKTVDAMNPQTKDQSSWQAIERDPELLKAFQELQMLEKERQASITKLEMARQKAPINVEEFIKNLAELKIQLDSLMRNFGNQKLRKEFTGKAEDTINKIQKIVMNEIANHSLSENKEETDRIVRNLSFFVKQLYENIYGDLGGNSPFLDNSLLPKYLASEADRQALREIRDFLAGKLRWLSQPMQMIASNFQDFASDPDLVKRSKYIAALDVAAQLNRRIPLGGVSQIGDENMRLKVALGRLEDKLNRLARVL